MLRHLLALALLSLFGCDYYKEQGEIDKRLEEVGLENAEAEVKLAEKLAEKEIGEPKK